MNDCVYDITFGFHYIIHKTFTKTSNYRNYDISAINRVYICMHTSCNFRVLIDEKGFMIAYRWIVLGFQNNIFCKWLFGMSWTFFFLECDYHSFKLYMLFQICLYYTVVCMVHKYNNGNPSRNVDSQRTTISKLEKKKTLHRLSSPILSSDYPLPNLPPCSLPFPARRSIPQNRFVFDSSSAKVWENLKHADVN